MALLVVGEMLVQVVGCDQLKDSVAQKLQPLIVAAEPQKRKNSMLLQQKEKTNSWQEFLQK